MEIYLPCELKNNELALYNQFKAVSTTLCSLEIALTDLTRRVRDLEDNITDIKLSTELKEIKKSSGFTSANKHKRDSSGKARKKL